MAKQLKLGEKAKAPVARAMVDQGKLVEYVVEGQQWLCRRRDLLAAELGKEISQNELAEFHLMIRGQERSWLIVRRLFGMMPVIPPQGYPLDDMKVWDRQALQEQLGITRQQLQAELDAVRGAWVGLNGANGSEGAELAPPPPPTEQLVFTDDEVLKKYGFKVVRGTVEDAAWFAERVRAMVPLLEEKLTSVLARNMLMTELQMHQLDEFLSDPEKSKLGTGEYRSNQKQKQELDKTYREQIQQLAKLAPWFSEVTGKHAFRDVLSDITRAIQEYHARGDTKLIDGMFTALEVKVECRRSVQASVRYRAGLVVWVNAAKAGLWDPNWKGNIPNAQLKKLDEAWRRAWNDLNASEPIPDLEKEGKEGEYAPLTQETSNTQ